MAFAELLNHFLFSCALAALAAIATYVMRRVSILDIPNHRSSHEQPVPNGGGVAIVLTVFVGFSAVYLAGDQVRMAESHLLGLGVASVAIVFVGLLDDLKKLQSFRIKLMTQISAAGVLLGFDIVIRNVALPFAGDVALGWWGYPVTLIWVIGLTNAFNFMDGLNGLAAGTAAICAAFFGLISFSEGSPFIYILCYVMAAASLGFLPFNFPRARIFMGDVGSQFLGFMFAALAVIAAEIDVSPTSMIVVPLLFFHFIFDTVFTMFRRFRAGENVTQAHRSHLYQLLNRIGWSHGRVSALQYGFAVLQGLGVLVVLYDGSVEPSLLIVPFLTVQLLYMAIVMRVARRHDLV
jgi:UDP-GlcNAc:undecaprenyl-phosphate/decaprenyl-phosphate GlcNAc-1-phosphate transferase